MERGPCCSSRSRCSPRRIPRSGARSRPRPRRRRGAAGAAPGGAARGPPGLPAGGVPGEEGLAGEVPPLARRIELGLASVDLDATGRTRLELAGLAPSGDGFAVLWSDERDGARHYRLQELDRELAPRGPSVPVDERASGKGQWEGSLAAGS